MSAAMRVWVSTIIGGLACVLVGAYDAFANHGAVLSSAGDVALILSGVGILTGKAAYDLGVAVPNPPKV